MYSYNTTPSPDSTYSKEPLQAVHDVGSRRPYRPPNPLLLTPDSTTKSSPDIYGTFNQSHDAKQDTLLITSTQTNPTLLAVSRSAQVNSSLDINHHLAKQTSIEIKHELAHDSEKYRGMTTPESFQQSNYYNDSAENTPDLNLAPNDLDMLPRTSIPSKLSWKEIARQSYIAAHSSRLHPYALHVDEYRLLKCHIAKKHVTIYLNIRNAILRLWHRSPLVPVTKKEAAGCARVTRYVGLALFVWEWLLRNGYINFGCCTVPPARILNPPTPSEETDWPRKRIVVVGAGVAGLACARQLEALFIQFADKVAASCQRTPTVQILEGRSRIGGRVYSYPLQVDPRDSKRTPNPTAELGAQIITGFDWGNPLNFIIRGQLALPCHFIQDTSIMYDIYGFSVDEDQDKKTQHLWNDILERASALKRPVPLVNSIYGDIEMLKDGREPKQMPNDDPRTLESYPTEIIVKDDNFTSTSEAILSAPHVGRHFRNRPSSDDTVTAAKAAQDLGYKLNPGVQRDQSIDLSKVAAETKLPSLGKVLDEGIRQYQDLITLSEQDLRLLNWHHANLEYANAVNLDGLNMRDWDQDTGNEFEGAHCEVIGGYTQFPRGLYHLPTRLDVKLEHEVSAIDANEDNIFVSCENGETFDANYVVLTAPLGVLKAKTISFQPALPDWKLDAIGRMGYGLLNKVILVYDTCFWEKDRDIIGLLNAPESSGFDQSQYAEPRGRFFLIWNCIKTAGKPVLVALMAGNAALRVEKESSDTILSEIMSRLGKIFGPKRVPKPREAIITLWSCDPFARGTYSYVGTETLPGDYDQMAKPVGDIHFAGEATCGSYPATVHGAYISGLRAAEEIFTKILGPMQVSPSLIPPLSMALDTPLSKKRKAPGYITVFEPVDKPDAFSEVIATQRAKSEYEISLAAAVEKAIGPMPESRTKRPANPYILYVKEKWEQVKASLEHSQKLATGSDSVERNSIRKQIGVNWKAEPAEVQERYREQCRLERATAGEKLKVLERRAKAWQEAANRIRIEFSKKHPPPTGVSNVR